MKSNAVIENVLGDGIGYVKLIEYMGGDIEAVDRARICYQSQERSTPESDISLLEKLVASKPLHGTTLRGCNMTFEVLAPQFVQKQWVRHLVGHDFHYGEIFYSGSDSFDIGGSFDEQSLRYTDKLLFYTPKDLPETKQIVWQAMIASQKATYENLRNVGFAKQLARCAVGPMVYSQMSWTCNLQGLLDWGHKRLPGGGAQGETAIFALKVLRLVYENVAPNAIKFWAEETGHWDKMVEVW